MSVKHKHELVFGYRACVKQEYGEARIWVVSRNDDYDR